MVSDTGPILHLHEAKILPLLYVTGQVLIPPAVDDELMGHLPDWRRPSNIECRSLSAEGRRRASAWSDSGLLDRGEAAALVLAEESAAGWFLTDDAAARVVAGGQGLEVHGSLGVVLWTAAIGYLDRTTAERALRALFQSSLWVSPRVREEALLALDVLFTAG